MEIYCFEKGTNLQIEYSFEMNLRISTGPNLLLNNVLRM